MKWEYKTVKLAIGNFLSSNFELTEIDKFVNQFGQQGWEIVSTLDLNSYSGGSVEIVLFFKRPLAE